MIKFLKSNNSLYVLTNKSLFSNVFTSLFLLCVVVVLNGCVKGGPLSPPTAPSITTNAFIVNATSVGAKSGGIVTDNGGASILTVGVCYSSTNSTPTIANSVTVDTLTTDNAGTQSFNSTLSGLTASTTYYVRAYATNSAGTGYGVTIKFTTSASLASIINTVSTFAGSVAGGYANGTGSAALFSNPQSLVTDAAGNVYVADSFNNSIRKITPAGDVTTYAGDGKAGYTDGPAATAEFYAPQSLAIDGSGNIFVSDVGNNVIREITAAGVVSTYAGNGLHGFINEKASLAEFNGPQGLCVDASGNVYVADRGNNIIRKISTQGKVTTYAGYYGAGVGLYNSSVDTTSVFNVPVGVAVDSKGNVYVADSKNYCIRKISSSGGVSTLVGGAVQTTLIGTPTSVSIDAKDNLFITDATGRIIEFSTSGSVVYVLGGSENTYGYLDGSGATAQFNNPQSAVVDSKGIVYVADYYNNVIRKIVSNVTTQ